MGSDKDGEIIMQETTNIALQKPESNEYINLEVLNGNFDKIDKAFGEIKNNHITQKQLTIPTIGWTTEANGPYKQKLVLPVEGITASSIVNITINLVSEEVAQDCGLASTNESGDGTITFYAESVPSQEIQVTYYVLETGGGEIG